MQAAFAKYHEIKDCPDTDKIGHHGIRQIWTFEKLKNKMDIINLTEEHLFEIVNISTGNYFKSEFASNQKEIETGGYGRRRLVKWKQEDVLNYFEIDGEAKDSGWHWYAWVIDQDGKRHNANCLNFSAVIDYCDKNGIDVRNKSILSQQ